MTLPDLRHLSQKERASLLTGSYKLSSKYNLKLEQDNFVVYSLCIVKRYSTRVSVCLPIGSNLEEVMICDPHMRADCLPSAIVQHYFGVSFWYQFNSTVMYIIADIDSSEIKGGRVITNMTTSLSALWYDTLGCQNYVHVQVLAIVAGALGGFCCLGFITCCLGIIAGYCCWLCHRYCKHKG